MIIKDAISIMQILDVHGGNMKNCKTISIVQNGIEIAVYNKLNETYTIEINEVRDITDVTIYIFNPNCNKLSEVSNISGKNLAIIKTFER